MQQSNNDLTKKIIQYFDKQMNPEDEKEFLEQIKNNPAGNSTFMKEMHIREKLKANVHRPGRTDHLANQIKEQIRKYPR
jgi:hypothetical protein